MELKILIASKKYQKQVILKYKHSYYNQVTDTWSDSTDYELAGVTIDRIKLEKIENGEQAIQLGYEQDIIQQVMNVKYSLTEIGSFFNHTKDCFRYTTLYQNLNCLEQRFKFDLMYLRAKRLDYFTRK